jgi:RuvB-like protein 2
MKSRRFSKFGTMILRIQLIGRSQEEDVTLSPEALSALAKIGIETSLRYAMQLLITSHLIAVKRKTTIVELRDVQRAYALFLDQARSVEFLHRNEQEFISGQEWEVGGRELNGTTTSETSVPMQDIQA